MSESVGSGKFKMVSSANLRKHIRLTERLIQMKKNQLPDLHKKYMWTLADEVTVDQKEKFIKLYKQCEAQDRIRIDELTELLERTIRSNEKSSHDATCEVFAFGVCTCKDSLAL